MIDPGYCSDPAQVRLYPGAAEALRELGERGFLRVLVTNQSGIGRGFFGEPEYEAVHAELLRQLGPGALDDARMCPDTPETPSAHRKPAPGMLLDAARDLGIDLARSFMVGDKPSDVAAGRNAATRTIRIADQPDPEADHTAATFADAARWILSRPTP